MTASLSFRFVVEIMKRFGWDRIAIFTSTDKEYSKSENWD